MELFRNNLNLESIVQLSELRWEEKNLKEDQIKLVILLNGKSKDIVMLSMQENCKGYFLLII